MKTRQRKRVCLINPSDNSEQVEDEKLFKEYVLSGYTVPHLGLGYIASVLHEKNFHVDIYECMGQDLDISKLISQIEKGNYAIFGITIQSTTIKNSVKIINRIKRRDENSFIIAGGYSASLSYEMFLNHFPAIDCCVLGEGELTTLMHFEHRSKQDEKDNFKVPFYGCALPELINHPLSIQTSCFSCQFTESWRIPVSLFNNSEIITPVLPVIYRCAGTIITRSLPSSSAYIYSTRDQYPANDLQRTF